MENCCNWEHPILINELGEGMEAAKQLQVHLISSSSTETRDLLLQRILSSYEKALLILKWSESSSGRQTTTNREVPITGVPESPFSVDGSPRSEDLDSGYKEHKDHKFVSKKRKVLPTWTNHVRICSENGLEGPNNDGYSWRKYGQKDILSAKYPRSYYRCTYRSVKNCWATKQVQRSDEDPTVFDITYRGKHTCHQVSNAVPPPTSPEKQKLKQNHHQENHQSQKPNEMLLNFRANLRVKTDDLDHKEIESPFTFPSTSYSSMKYENQTIPISMVVDDNLLGGYSPSFISPDTSESNYFSVSHCQMNDFRGVHILQHAQSDLAEIISANTSSTNSPMLDLDFSIEHVNLDHNFPFDTSEFFN